MISNNYIDKNALPRHVAVIMDGNGRWALKKGSSRLFGHRSGLKAVREVIEGAGEIGIEYLTLFAFSTENWRRPRIEVEALMQLLVDSIRKETKFLHENGIKLNAIGNLSALPRKCYQELQDAIELTKDNTSMTLTLALSYGARSDMIAAIKKIVGLVNEGIYSSDEIDEKIISNALSTAAIPDPDLLIRTSGELRVSNFLLWEIAYAEIFVTHKYWPDFRREDLQEAIVDFQSRERRFGKISEQIHK